MCDCLPHTPHWGPSLQPRHVPWPGIKPATLWFAGRHSVHWATPARALNSLFSNLIFLLLPISLHLKILCLGLMAWTLGCAPIHNSNGNLLFNLKTQGFFILVQDYPEGSILHLHKERLTQGSGNSQVTLFPRILLRAHRCSLHPVGRRELRSFLETWGMMKPAHPQFWVLQEVVKMVSHNDPSSWGESVIRTCPCW